MSFDIERAEEVRHQVIGAAVEVHRRLGPGLLEAVYADCLVIECTDRSLNLDTDVHVPLFYGGRRVRSDLRIDLLVEDLVVVEVKAVAAIVPVHVAQVITYLKLANRPAGVLLNFNVELMKNGIRRIDHPSVWKRNHPERPTPAAVEGPSASTDPSSHESA